MFQSRSKKKRPKEGSLYWRATELREKSLVAASHVRFPLVVKLIGIITVIVVVSMLAITLISSYFFSEDSRARAEENNLTLSEVLASQIEDKIESVFSGVLSLLDVLRSGGHSPSLERVTASDFFDRNPEVIYIAVPGKLEIANEKFLSSNELPSDFGKTLQASFPSPLERARGGDILVRNASPSVGLPSAALFAPYTDLGDKNVLIIVFSTESLQSLVQTSSATISYVVASDGSLVLHPNFSLVKAGVNFSDHELVKRLLSVPADNMQIRYKDSDGGEYLGAFRKLQVGGLAVTSSTPTALVYRFVLETLRRNLYLTGIVLLFSILAVWLFSRSVSRPVLVLVDASRRIEEGQYELDIRARTRDELGLLTESFVEMGRGLAERERVKETFGKFVNKTIAEQALKGELSLGGTRRIATIFFADIRSFTAISERLSPEAVVEFLNDYMTRMVACIDSTGGVVDKFIGDAIMGVWGAPASAGSPKEDALMALKAMVAMRYALLDFNRGRGGADKPLIHNGCGVNTGPCIAGQIGSSKRMEYTVIGDAVNLASRIEALNKAFGTDILISENTYTLVKDQVIVQAMPAIKVKGKAEPLTIYAVIKLRGDKGPETLAELRKLLGITPPQAELDINREEVKYEILQK